MRRILPLLLVLLPLGGCGLAAAPCRVTSGGAEDRSRRRPRRRGADGRLRRGDRSVGGKPVGIALDPSHAAALNAAWSGLRPS